MPIEFCCPQCERVLRVSEEHAGKAARCPDCSTVMHVPGGNQPPEEPSMTYGFGGIESPVPRYDNQPHAKTPAGPDPWARPQFGTDQRPRKPLRDGQVRPTAVSFDSIISYAWNASLANFGLLLGVNFLVMGVGLFFVVTQLTIDGALQPGNAGNGAVAAGSLAGSMIGIVGNLISMFLSIGQVRINYDIARKGRADFATLFTGGDKFLPMLGASLLVMIAMALGFICLIIPGLMMVVVFWPYFHLIADNKESAMGSFNTALEIGKRNIVTSILLCLISFLVVFFGALALLIGLIFVIPFLSMLWSVAYLKMAGQI